MKAPGTAGCGLAELSGAGEGEGPMETVEFSCNSRVDVTA
jgi:hypothetical protein